MFNYRDRDRDIKDDRDDRDRRDNGTNGDDRKGKAVATKIVPLSTNHCLL